MVRSDEMMFQRLGTKVTLHLTDRGHYAKPLFENGTRSSRGPRVDHNVCLIGEDAGQANGPESQPLRVQHEPLGQALDGESQHRGQYELQQAGQLGRLERPPLRGRAVGLSSQWHDSPDSGEVWSQAARPHSGIRDLHERQGLCEMDPRPYRGGSPDVQVHEKDEVVCGDERQSKESACHDGNEEPGLSLSEPASNCCQNGAVAKAKAFSTPSRVRKQRDTDMELAEWPEVNREHPTRSHPVQPRESKPISSGPGALERLDEEPQEVAVEMTEGERPVLTAGADLLGKQACSSREKK